MDTSFFSNEFMPHGHCFLWTPGILWTHVVSDALIAASYYSIPLVLFTFVRRRPDMVFNWVFVMFGLFIFACGTNHVLAIWTTWSAQYGIEAIAKVSTATISVMTAVALWPLLPRALALPSPSQLASTNEKLLEQVGIRQAAEEKLRVLADELDERVRARTEELEAKAAELERSNRDLEEFACVVSHDLKSPLRGISNLADWISADHGEALGESGGGQLDLLKQRVDRMYKLIDGVLAYSRAGRESVLAEVDLNELCEAVVSTLDVPAGVRVELQPDMPSVRYDRSQLTQVLLNLVGNAVGHLGSDRGRVAVSARAVGSRVEISVADDGPGIEPEHRERVFRMFQTLGTPGSSTGIGLAIVKKIVESRGGQIHVGSGEQGGSVFRFTAPLSG